MNDDDIINQYKIIKEKERERNKKAYEKLKNNKVKYRERLTNAYEYQVKRIQEIKQDEEKYKEFKETHSLINKQCYYKRMFNKVENQINNIKLD
jgi:hypothetical protein